MKKFLKCLGFRAERAARYYHERKEYTQTNSQGKYFIQECWSVEEKLKDYYFLGFCFCEEVLEVNKYCSDYSKKKLFTKWSQDKVFK